MAVSTLVASGVEEVKKKIATSRPPVREAKRCIRSTVALILSSSKTAELEKSSRR